jgi:hypothetical protein
MRAAEQRADAAASAAPPYLTQALTQQQQLEPSIPDELDLAAYAEEELSVLKEECRGSASLSGLPAKAAEELTGARRDWGA